jgi:predicted dehydrogenase
MKMTDKKFKWGILGPGRIAHQFANGLKVIDDASLYAVASSKIERAKEFADEYGGAKTYNSYEVLVNDPEVDGVYIATPHRFHFENVMLALNAGKPVLCEKPLTVNAGETKKLIETSKKNKVFLMEALWSRFLPIYSVIRKWLDEKAIGDISLMMGTFGFNAPKDKDDRWQNPELAGGTLLDMGIYPIAISQWIMQAQPKSFVTMAHIGNTGVDELTTILLKYENDVISQCHSSFMSNHTNDFLIYGSKGYIRIHPAFWGSTKASLVVDDQELTVSRPFRAGGFEYQTEEAMRCVRAGLLESPGMSHADTLANMELMDSIRAEIGLKYPFEK